jgi:5-methylcytosine-specific restriction endonuclease McrA
MIREGVVSIASVFESYERVMEEQSHFDKVVAEFDGYNIKFSSHRLWTFYECGIICELCGIEGDFFAIERNHSGEVRPHLNLYAKTDDDEEVLLTKDHIVPSSKGGENYIGNYQTLCKPCNEKKGDSEDN